MRRMIGTMLALVLTTCLPAPGAAQAPTILQQSATAPAPRWEVSLEGRVGFPTIVNEQPAFFSWRHGEDGVHYWHFLEHTTRRPIPASWTKSAEISLVTKS